MIDGSGCGGIDKVMAFNGEVLCGEAIWGSAVRRYGAALVSPHGLLQDPFENLHPFRICRNPNCFTGRGVFVSRGQNIHNESQWSLLQGGCSLATSSVESSWSTACPSPPGEYACGQRSGPPDAEMRVHDFFQSDCLCRPVGIRPLLLLQGPCC